MLIHGHSAVLQIELARRHVLRSVAANLLQFAGAEPVAKAGKQGLPYPSSLIFGEDECPLQFAIAREAKSLVSGDAGNNSSRIFRDEHDAVFEREARMIGARQISAHTLEPVIEYLI